MPDRGLTKAQIERFQRLAWPHLAAVLRTARYLTRRDADADDLAQETMMKAMRFIDSYEDDTDMKAWLMTILQRTHIDRLRADRRHADEVSIDAAQTLQLEATEDAEPGQFDDRWDEPESLLERFEDEEMIQALKSLPEDHRWTLLLVDVERIDHADAAEILGVPVGTIKSRAHYGRRMLRDRLHQVASKRGWVSATERPRA